MTAKPWDHLAVMVFRMVTYDYTEELGRDWCVSIATLQPNTPYYDEQGRKIGYCQQYVRQRFIQAEFPTLDLALDHAERLSESRLPIIGHQTVKNRMNKHGLM